jgi:hypothetical protein
MRDADTPLLRVFAKLRSLAYVGAIDVEEIVDARSLQEGQQSFASLFLSQQELLGIEWDNAEEPDLAVTTDSQAAKCGGRPVRLGEHRGAEPGRRAQRSESTSRFTIVDDVASPEVNVVEVGHASKALQPMNGPQILGIL